MERAKSAARQWLKVAPKDSRIMEFKFRLGWPGHDPFGPPNNDKAQLRGQYNRCGEAATKASSAAAACVGRLNVALILNPACNPDCVTTGERTRANLPSATRRCPRPIDSLGEQPANAT